MIIEIKSCTKCGLYKNQLPLIDKCNVSDIMWVGLSAKAVDNIDEDIPLSCNTNTGKIINRIESEITHLRFYKTNLVKCVPLNEEGKLRYPITNEMHLCYDNLLCEINKINPKIIFLLGDKVSKFVLKHNKIQQPKFSIDYSYDYYKLGNKYFVPIHHPSYMAVYKRKYIDEYVRNVTNLINRVWMNDVNMSDVV